MSDKMIPISFEELLIKLLKEYKESTSFMGVPVKRIKDNVPIGPAAGPHTQLAGNIICAYGAGASYFELKTVQILEGEELQIKKPCIYVGNEVFNTEWSTELTVEQAQNEYIKAYIILNVLSKEFCLGKKDGINFIMSVGYDLEGIKSKKIDSFLENMKNAENTFEWKKDIDFIKDHINMFDNFTLDDVEEISPEISDTVTLSTMHGCKSSEIENIALYLINQKKLNTYIKMNPTLAGSNKIKEIFKNKGYDNLHFKEEMFEKDISLDNAFEMLTNVKSAADKVNKNFGVKLTNTFPISIEENQLEGEDMYMSGPALYPISIYVAGLIADKFNGDISISYSGGADLSNIEDILNTGIKPVTVSSILLKPGGYKNLTRLSEKAALCDFEESINIDKIKDLGEKAEKNSKYDYKETKHKEKSTKEYSEFCGICNNCSDVCPNRANIKIVIEDKTYVIHRDRLCNECGCCTFSCAMGHVPYKEKFMLFEDKKEFEKSDVNGVLYTSDEKKYRFNKVITEIPEHIEQIIKTGYEKGCI